MQHWLMKSEPHVYSIDDLRKDGTTHWDGVRNYQARNFMRDGMKVGDKVLFYHSNTQPPHVAGIAKVVKEAYPDHTAWDPQAPHFDPKTVKDDPRWFMVDIGFVETFEAPVSLAALKDNPNLDDMLVVQRGQRLSVQPVTKAHFDEVVRMAQVAETTAI